MSIEIRLKGKYRNRGKARSYGGNRAGNSGQSHANSHPPVGIRKRPKVRHRRKKH